MGTATRLPRSYWRLAAYAVMWAVVAYIITLLAFVNLHKFVPYTYQLHLQRTIFPYGPHGSGIMNVDKYANETRLD